MWDNLNSKSVRHFLGVFVFVCVCASLCPIFPMKKIKQNARIHTFGPDFGYFTVVLRRKPQSFHWHHCLTFGEKKNCGIFPNLKNLQICFVTFCHLQPLGHDRFFVRHRKEMGFFVGGELPALGRPITINEAADHIFGSSDPSGPGFVRLDKSLRNG